MAAKVHLKTLLQGTDKWNAWRRKHLGVISPDLTSADLTGVNLSAANLRGADLSGANLSGVNLTEADLTGAMLIDANLTEASLFYVRLINANLTGADFSRAILSGAFLIRTTLSETKFPYIFTFATVFGNVDLRGAEGLETVRHVGPSEISLSTIYKSAGKIPEAFLRGCGLPESLIVQIPGMVTAMQPLQSYSCFISYSGRDEEFARRLHSRMREADLQVWFAPEDMKGGDKLYDQIDRAIQAHDRLLLVLSESSLQSKWVETEIHRARKAELREGRRKLFPIRLVSYEALREWTCIDSTTGEDLAEEVRGYFIPDFSDWKSHNSLEQAFARLLADLKASA